MTDLATPGPCERARALLRSTESGILSTLSLEIPGYPFGSVTPYVVSLEGRPLILVSDIAQHTANMNADSRCCLSVEEAGAGNPQERGRLTFVGDARRVPEDRLVGASARYFASYPHARHYSQAHAFSFYEIEPVRLRLILGFGQIHWVEADEWTRPLPEWHAAEAGMIEHMNRDHQDAMQRIVEAASGARPTEVEMLAIDPDGCHLRADGTRHFVPFDAPCPSADSVRQALIALARRDPAAGS